MLARRFHKGKGKFKGKLPIICFNCNEIVTLQIYADKIRITKMEENSRTREKMVKNITKTKPIDATLLKKTLMTMVMK